MVLEMENSRRPFDRSRDPAPMKKPRVAEEPIRAPNSNSRQFPSQRPVTVPPLTSRFRAGGRETESISSDPSREAYQPQPVNPHHELVSQYKSALAELTFNSKPIITNLTIIAGENLLAAKAIGATICNNILEVPSDQKLPSLYLLDSIVKNIGRDYIKHFAAKLPEVFIKAYKQVDPPTHSNMRHLFGTWKGVFHPQTLQIIEKELGFTSRSDGSSSSVPTARGDPQSQRPPHSIHVNPKYLERQRLQQSGRAKGMVSDVPENIPNSMGDSDRLDRASSLKAGGTLVEPSVTINSMRRAQIESLGEHLYEKNVGSTPSEYDYVSDLPQNSRLGIKKANLRIADEGREKQWYGARGSIPEMISGQSGGLNSKSRIPLCSTARSAAGISSISMSSSWKNSEEEEFTWDMHSRLSETDVANINPENEIWTPDESERLEPENHLLRLPRFQDVGSRIDLENSTDLYSSDRMDRKTYGCWKSSPRSLQDSLIQRNSEDYSSVVDGLPPVSGSRKGIQPQVSRARVTAGSGILQNSGSGSDRLMPIHDSASLQNSAKEDFKRSNSLAQRDPRASRFPVKPQNISMDDPARCLAPSDQFRNTKVLEPPPESQAKTLDSLPTTESAPGRPDRTVSESSGQSNINNLLAAVMKKGILSNNLTNSLSKDETFQDEEKPRTQRVQQAVSVDLPQKGLSRAVPASLPNTSAGGNLSTRIKVEEPAASTSAPTSKEIPKASDPISSLLSSLISKGFISASKAEAPSLFQCQVPSTIRDHSPDHSTNSSTSAASAVQSDFQPMPLVDRVAPPAEPKIKGSTAPSETIKVEPEDFIGLQFRPCKIREFHPSVINSLFDDLPHRCSTCGVHLKHEEQLGKHLEIHDKKKLDASNTDRRICVWFPKANDWVAGNSRQLEHEPAMEDGLLIPADENQCACILCGKMFEDHFSQETDQWMFKGAVYMTIPTAKPNAKGPIVHATCLNDSSAQDLGLEDRDRQENDV